MSVTSATCKTSESTLVGSGGTATASASKAGSGGVATGAVSKGPIYLTSESEHTHAFAKKAFMGDYYYLLAKPLGSSFDRSGVYLQGKNERVVILNQKDRYNRQLSVLSLSDPSDYESGPAPMCMYVAPSQLLMVSKNRMLRNDSKMSIGEAELKTMVRTDTPTFRKPKTWAGVQLHFSEPYPWPASPSHFKDGDSFDLPNPDFKDEGSFDLPKVDGPVSCLAYDEMSQSVVIGTRSGALIVKKARKDATIVRQPIWHDYRVIFLGIQGTTLVVVDLMSIETWDINTLVLQSRYQPTKEKWGWDREGIPYVSVGGEFYSACYASGCFDYTTGTLFARRYSQRAEAGHEQTQLLDVFENVTTELVARKVYWGPAPYDVGTIAAENGVLFLQLCGGRGSQANIIAAFHTQNPPIATKATKKGALTWPLIQQFTIGLFSQMCAGRNALVLAGGTGEIRLLPLNRQDEAVTLDPFADILFKHEPGYDVYTQEEDFFGQSVRYRGDTIHRQSDKKTVALLPWTTWDRLEVLNLDLDQSENDLVNFGREKSVVSKYQMKGQVTFFGRTRFTILDDSKRTTFEIEPAFDVAFLGVVPKRIIEEYSNDALEVTFQKAESVPTKITHELYDESSDTHFMAEATGLIRVVVGPQSLEPASRVLERAPDPVIFMGVYLKKLVIVGESSIEIWNINTFTRVGNFGTVTKSVGSGGAASAAASNAKAIYAAAALDQTTGQLFVKRASSTEKEHVMDVFENLDILRPRRFLNYYPYDLTSFDAENGTLFMYFVMQSELQWSGSSGSELRKRYGIPDGTCSIVCPFHTANGTIMNVYTHEATWPGFKGFPLKNDLMMRYERSKVVAGKKTLLHTHSGGVTLYPLKYAKANTAVTTVQPTAAAQIKTSANAFDAALGYPRPISKIPKFGAEETATRDALSTLGKTATEKTAVTVLQPTATAPAPTNPFEIALGYPRPISAKTPKFVAEETATRQALSNLGKNMKEAVDNGDCFYHSCAMLLNHHKGLNLTVSDIRKQVASTAQAAANTIGQENWLLPYFNNDVLEFKRWVKNVSTTGSIPGTIVEWGNFERDTAILGRIYGVSFKLFINGKFSEESFGMKASKTVLEVAQFSNHFAPIF